LDQSKTINNENRVSKKNSIRATEVSCASIVNSNEKISITSGIENNIIISGAGVDEENKDGEGGSGIEGSEIG
jgi:hypothetical protein